MAAATSRIRASPSASFADSATYPSRSRRAGWSRLSIRSCSTPGTRPRRCLAPLSCERAEPGTRLPPRRGRQRLVEYDCANGLTPSHLKLRKVLAELDVLG